MAVVMGDPHAGAAGYHAVHLPEHPARTVVWQAVAEHLGRWIPPCAHVLEVGAGYCHWINAVRAVRRVAVDSWPGFPAFAAPGVETHVMDAATLLPSLGAARFHVALASNVLEHFTPDTAAVVTRDLAAILVPGGRLLIVQPNFRYAYRRYFDDYTHRSVFTHVSLSNLLRANGFHIDVLEPRFLPYSVRGVSWPVRRWMVRAYLLSPIRPFAGQMLIVARKI